MGMAMLEVPCIFCDWTGMPSLPTDIQYRWVPNSMRCNPDASNR